MTLTVDHLMDAPLQQLVDELRITLGESPISDPEFTGAAYVDRNRVVLSLPAGRSELEHDCMARYLIGQAFHVDGLPPLPELWEVTEFSANDGDSDPDMDEARRRVRAGGVA